MSRKKVFGRCSICGKEGKLTFEHVPPESAFNDHPTVIANFEDVIGKPPDAEIPGRIQQRGSGDYTLCSSCNNQTGKWYGTAFADFCYQGMEKLVLANGNPSLSYLYHIFPLRVIKQIVTMFFSLNQGMGLGHKDFVKFVLNRDARYLPKGIRFFIYYASKGRVRRTGVAGMGGVGERPIVLSEFTFPPFGYVMLLNGDPPHPQMVDITDFSRFHYYDVHDIPLRLPALETHLIYPGDYRTKEQILADFKANQISSSINSFA